jgi:hypothetical protein
MTRQRTVKRSRINKKGEGNMAEQNLFGNLFEEKKGELDFKSKKGRDVKISYTIAGGEDITGIEDSLKLMVDLLENDDAQPKTDKGKQEEEKKQGGQ